MKKILRIIIVVLLITSSIKAVEIKQGKVWIINYSPLSLDPPENDVSYRARDKITLKPGFSFDSRGTANHFNGKIDNTIISTYEYMEQEELIDPDTRVINTNLAVGSISGEANVTPTGAFTYNIPIYCSPGTNGLQPSISLNYNSQSTNGILGWGWSLGGLSAITRTGKDMFRDGDILQFENLPTDNLALDGNRLVVLEGSWNTDNTVMGTEIGNTSRIYPFAYNGEGYTSFWVQTKEGNIIEYGNTPDSKISVSYMKNGVEKSCIIDWRINKVIDKFGNYMLYEYIDINGESLLKRIKYTGNTSASLQPYASIEFYYSERADKNRKYIAINGTHTNTIDNPQNNNTQAYLSENNILDRIDAKYGNDIIRSYRINYYNNSESYEYSSNYTINTNEYSLLNKIIEIGEDGTQLNPLIFNYNNKESRDKLLKYNQVSAHNFQNAGRDDMVFGDFNGDGIMDRMVVQRDMINQNNYHLAAWNLQIGQYFECDQGINNCGSYTFTNFNSQYPKMFDTYDWEHERYKLLFDKTLAFDIDLDGKDELLIPYFYGFNYDGKDFWENLYIKIYKFNGNNFDIVSTITIPTHLEIKSMWRIKDNLIITPGDFNGDGIFEILLQFNEEIWDCGLFSCDYDHTLKIADYVTVFDESNNWLTNPNIQLWKIIDPNKNTQIIPINMNGNIKSDLLIINNNENHSLSEYLEMDDNGDFIPKSFDDEDLSDTLNIKIGDLNGDGLLDLVYGNSISSNNPIFESIRFKYNTGNGFSDEYILQNEELGFPNQFLVSDFNGDGKSDIVLIYLFADFTQTTKPITRVEFACYFSDGYNKFDLQVFKTNDQNYFPTNYYPEQYNELFKLSQFSNFDFNGDGNSDLYNFGGSGYGKILSFYSNNNPLHLKSISDGFGNKTEVIFDIVSNPDGAYKNDITSQLPLRDLKSNMYVVKDVKKFQYLFNNNPKTDLLQTYSYQYKNGLIHKYKGFLGFKEFSTINEMEVDEESSPKIIKLASISQFGLDGNNKYTLNPIKNIVSMIDGNNTFTSSVIDIEYSLKSLNSGKNYFFYESKISSNDYLTGITTSTDNIYDDWQNLTSTTQTFGSDAIPTIIQKYYNYDNYFLSWCNSRLHFSWEKTRHKDDPYSENLRSTNYDYYSSTKGFALKKIINDPYSGNPLTIEFDYNQFGGVIKETKSFPNPTLTSRVIERNYSNDGRFVISEWNALNHKKEYTYSNSTGAVLTSKDINGDITSYQYDGFGKHIIKI